MSTRIEHMMNAHFSTRGNGNKMFGKGRSRLPEVVFIFLIVIAPQHKIIAQWNQLSINGPGNCIGAPSLQIRPDTRQPYVAYRTPENGCVVKKYNGVWTDVGGDLSPLGNAVSPSLLFHPQTNEPYVIHTQAYGSGFKYVVKKFNGNNWVQIGRSFGFFSNGDNSRPSMLFKPITNELVVAHWDLDLEIIFVMRFDESVMDWVDLGSVWHGGGGGFSLASKTGSGELYITRRSDINTSIARFTGTVWQTIYQIEGIGTAGLAYGFRPGLSTQIIAHSNGETIEVKTLSESPQTMILKEFHFIEGTHAGGVPSISFKPLTNEPYICYWALNNRLVVKKLQGTAFTQVGAQIQGLANQFSPSMAFDPVSGRPYVAYQSGGLLYVILYDAHQEDIGSTSVGANALPSNVSGLNNTAIGLNSLYNNVSGSSNTTTGYHSGYSNTSGSNNTAIGAKALVSNKTGVNNTSIGYEALLGNNNGGYNTSIGSRSMASVTSGSSNTVVGYNTGVGITTGSANTIIGANVTNLPPALSNSIIIADGQGNQRLFVDNTGKTRIGNPSLTLPGSYKLYVETGILTERVVVAIANSMQWADYVFDPDYPLMPLSEVAAFIRNNKHLPDVPDAANVKQNGIDLGKMDALLLKKIEELTLYLIEQKRENEFLRKEVNELKVTLKKNEVKNNGSN